MVRIHVKHGEGLNENEFLYDCESTLLVGDIAVELVRISNLQSKINRLVAELEPRLAHLHGDQQAVAMPLIRALSEAKAYASKDQVIHNRPSSFHALTNLLRSIEREFMANLELLCFSDSNQFHQLLVDLELLQENSTQLRWAAKDLMRDKRLCDYIGRNEKTKIIVKLHPSVSLSA